MPSCRPLSDSFFNDSLSKTEKIKQAIQEGGGLADGLAEAAIGLVVLVIGTALGGLVGGALGAWGGFGEGCACRRESCAMQGALGAWGGFGEGLANTFTHP